MNKPRATTAGVARGGCRRTRAQRKAERWDNKLWDSIMAAARRYKEAKQAHKHGGTHEQG